MTSIESTKLALNRKLAKCYVVPFKIEMQFAIHIFAGMELQHAIVLCYMKKFTIADHLTIAIKPKHVININEIDYFTNEYVHTNMLTKSRNTDKMIFPSLSRYLKKVPENVPFDIVQLISDKKYLASNISTIKITTLKAIHQKAIACIARNKLIMKSTVKFSNLRIAQELLRLYDFQSDSKTLAVIFDIPFAAFRYAFFGEIIAREILKTNFVSDIMVDYAYSNSSAFPGNTCKVVLLALDTMISLHANTELCSAIPLALYRGLDKVICNMRKYTIDHPIALPIDTDTDIAKLFIMSFVIAANFENKYSDDNIVTLNTLLKRNLGFTHEVVNEIIPFLKVNTYSYIK
jgi:hypothetical protein